MKERSILFSAPMVRAILCGAKTQTRRAMTNQPDWDATLAPAGWCWTGKKPGEPELIKWPNEATFARKLTERAVCPYGQPGDRLRVKEAAWMWCERRPNGTTKTGRHKWRYVPMRAAGIFYAADHRVKPNIWAHRNSVWKCS